MVNFLKIITVIFLSASIIVGARFLLNYSGFYTAEKPFDLNSIKHPEYIFKTQNISEIPDVELPDMSVYTPKNLKFNFPEVQSGEVVVQNLTHGIRDLRLQADIFGEKQERLDALAIVIKRGIYDLETLTAQVSDNTLIEKIGEGVFILHVPLSIRMAGGLIVQEGEILYLNSNTGALISNFGALHIIGAQILGWDVKHDKFSAFNDSAEFRPYLVTWCGAEMNVVESRVSYLGYDADRAHGLTYTACTNTLYADEYADYPSASGWVIDSRFEGLYQGFSAIQVDRIAVLRNQYEGSISYGIGLHDGSSNMIVAYNDVHGTKSKHGIVVEEESSHNVLAYNVSTQNGESGLSFFESPDNVTYKNKLMKNKKVGLRVRQSTNIHSYHDVINYNEQGGAHISGGETSIFMLTPELVGNVNTNFKVEGADYLEILKPVLYKSPNNFFTGDLGDFSVEFINGSLGVSDGFSFTRNVVPQ